jgi:hypothetical protein
MYIMAFPEFHTQMKFHELFGAYITRHWSNLTCATTRGKLYEWLQEKLWNRICKVTGSMATKNLWIKECRIYTIHADMYLHMYAKVHT